MSTSKAAPRKKRVPSTKAPVPTPAPVPKPERFLVLVRHGIAEDPTEGKDDADRSLTPEGHARMKEIARGIENIFPKVQAIYSSPLLRAVQTSLWIQKAYRSRVTISTSEVLALDASQEAFLAFVESIEERRAIVVGHEPSLTSFLRTLLGSGTMPIELKKGGCYGVRLMPDGSAMLEWFLPPRILRKLG